MSDGVALGFHPGVEVAPLNDDLRARLGGEEIDHFVPGAVVDIDDIVVRISGRGDSEGTTEIGVDPLKWYFGPRRRDAGVCYLVLALYAYPAVELRRYLVEKKMSGDDPTYSFRMHVTQSLVPFRRTRSFAAVSIDNVRVDWRLGRRLLLVRGVECTGHFGVVVDATWRNLDDDRWCAFLHTH